MRSMKRIVLLMSSMILLVIVGATRSDFQAASGGCHMCATQCAGDLQVHCLGNASCPWPAAAVTCASDYDCLPGVSVNCYAEIIH
jgi:hypothetical protein